MRKFRKCKRIHTVQVHHYYRKDQSLHFVSIRHGPWEVFALRTNLFGDSKAFLSEEKQYSTVQRTSNKLNFKICDKEPEDQRSCNTHVTPGPDRERDFAFFHNFKHVYSPSAYKPFGTSSVSILKLLLFPSFCTSSRKIPFASLFGKMILLFQACIEPQ